MKTKVSRTCTEDATQGSHTNHFARVKRLLNFTLNKRAGTESGRDEHTRYRPIESDGSIQYIYEYIFWIECLKHWLRLFTGSHPMGHHGKRMKGDGWIGLVGELR